MPSAVPGDQLNISPVGRLVDPRIDGLRRTIVFGTAGASLASLAACGGGSTPAAMASPDAPAPFPPQAGSNAERSLPIMALDEGVDDAAGGRLFWLRAQHGSAQMLSGVSTRSAGYNGAVLGPALRLHTGLATTVRVQNDLGEATTVHWHGLIVPAEMDGGPHQSIPAGGVWEARFTVANAASTCWYHPHAHGSTGRQVVSGLAGLLIVDDAAVADAALPHTWGVDDLALVIQDKRFTSAGQIDYALSAGEQLTGYIGDRLLVNGVDTPVWQAPRQWVRLRLLNGCNARTLALRLSPSVSMVQIANEAGLLAAPVTRANLTLAPGERAEVLVDFSGAAAGEEAVLHASALSGGMGMGGVGMGMGAASNSAEIAAMKVRVSLPRQPAAMAAPPVSMVAAPAVVAGAGATVRSFTLDGGMMGRPFTINGRSFDMDRVDFAVAARTVEVWRFVNATGMAHPMHVHGVRMSMLARGGRPPAAYEQGTRDTFVVDAMQTVVLAVQTPAAASSVPLTFHCHVLEHEDAGMMGQFITV